ncbi:beta-1,4-glucuronyltransferase 1 isoform X2 [Oratosquilla oratoria]|uniref:beta-1,4-glucuronyltransferase 1 isoform X2 n=1 Tax=Oratosquilla oratoria TaxID=337810 RepID=UPI003F777686
MMLCKLWGVGMFSIVALTASNILLTLRLLRVKDEGALGGCRDGLSPVFLTASGTGGGSGSGSGSGVNKGWSLTHTNQSEYLSFLRNLTLSSTSAGGGSGRGGGAFSIDRSKGRWDSRRKYRIHDHVFTSPQYGILSFPQPSPPHGTYNASRSKWVPRRGVSTPTPVCLATQTSLDRLFWLTQAPRHWTGPISVAVFAPDVEYSLARVYLQYLLACFPYVGEKVSVHLAYPKEHPPKQVPVVVGQLLKACGEPLTVLKQLLRHRQPKMLSWREKMAYPQNMLRNVARSNCHTDFVFLVDVDIVPIPGLSTKLSNFLDSEQARKCRKCAFVVPTYEVDERAHLPHNRSELLRLTSKGLARPFHQKVFVHNQHATNFSRWEAREKEFPLEQEVTISHPVTNFEFFYEPFYVARDDVPQHDERFVGYGFTRNTQVYEMFVSGYSFQVLAPIFTLHWGMQGKMGRPAWREKQNNANRRLFEGFKKEVFARYQRDPLHMVKKNNR